MLKFVFEREAKLLLEEIAEEDYEAVISILFAYTKWRDKKAN
jgi:hypothetical protein